MSVQLIASPCNSLASSSCSTSCSTDSRIKVSCGKYISEVVLRAENGEVYSVNTCEVVHTAGLHNYTCAIRKSGTITAGVLCPQQHGVSCALRERCPHIHTRYPPAAHCTPCCAHHGDDAFPEPQQTLRINGRLYRVPEGRTARTAAPCGEKLARSTICVDHILGRCTLGRACTKRHICRAWVQKLGLADAFVKPTEENVEGALVFRPEVVVRCSNGSVGALPRSALLCNEALKRHEKNSSDPMKPLRICEAHLNGNCPARGGCRAAHLDTKVLANCPQNLPTPCCWRHGDIEAQKEHGVSGVIVAKRRCHFPLGCVAKTAAAKDRAWITPSEVCADHLRGQCAAGRHCTRYHVCRQWARRVDLLQVLLVQSICPTPAMSITSASVSAEEDDGYDSDSSIPTLLSECSDFPDDDELFSLGQLSFLSSDFPELC